MPKEMLPLVDVPTIQLVVEEAVASGIKDILIITGKGKRAIEDHFDSAAELEQHLEKKGDEKNLRVIRRISELANIHYTRQKEARGLGDAILCAKSFVNGKPFAVLLGDDYYRTTVPHLKQIINAYNKLNSGVVSVMKVPQNEISRYGIVGGDKIDERTLLIRQLVEKPKAENAPSDLAISGRYILPPEVFEILETLEPGVGGEVQLTDALQKLAQSKAMYAYLFDGTRYDIGTKIGYFKAFVEYGLAKDELKEEVKAYLKNLSKTIK